MRNVFDEVYDAVQLIVMGDITEAMNRHNKKKVGIESVRTYIKRRFGIQTIKG